MGEVMIGAISSRSGLGWAELGPSARVGAAWQMYQRSWSLSGLPSARELLQIRY
jgi:hypothetical protein